MSRKRRPASAKTSAWPSGLRSGAPRRCARGSVLRVRPPHASTSGDCRSEAFTPRDHDARQGRPGARPCPPRAGRGFLLVTGHVELGDGSRDAAGATVSSPAVVGPAGARPERAGDAAEAARRGSASSRSTSARRWRRRSEVRAAVERPRRRAPRGPRVPGGPGHRPVLRPADPVPAVPALLARFCGCPILPGFFLRTPTVRYFNVWGEPLGRIRRVVPDEDAVRIMTPRRRRPRARDPSPSDPVVQLLSVLERSPSRSTLPPIFFHATRGGVRSGGHVFVRLSGVAALESANTTHGSAD